MAKEKQTLSAEELIEQALVPEDKQPYEVPDNWVWTRLGYVAKWGSGGTPSRKIPEYYHGYIPWIKTGELNSSYIFDTEEKITEEAIKKSSAKLFPINTVVIAMYGATIGKVGIMGVKATTNQACACGVASIALNFLYLFYYVLFQRDNFIEAGKGGAQPNISQEIIKAHICPLPPLTEQHRIVDRIECLFEKLDHAKELIQNALDTFENRKAAILHKAFTGELTKKWRDENGVGIESWKDVTLSDIAEWGSGGTPSRKIQSYFEGTIPWLKTGELNNGYLFDSEEKITLEAIKNSSAKLFPKGTVLIAMYGATIGKVAILGIEATTNQACACAITKGSTDERFLFYYLLSQKQAFINKGKGGAQPNISQMVVKQHPFPLPSISEQKEIVHILNYIFEKEQKAEELCDMIEKINLIKKAILVRAFRGKLGTNIPDEPSAIELLIEN